MTALTAFYDYVLPDLSGLTPGAFALQLIREGAIAFCERAQVITMDHPPVDLVALTDTYALNPGVGLLVVSLKKVLVSGASIDPAIDDDLDLQYGDTWRNGELAPGVAQFYRCPDETHIQIVPNVEASVTGGLEMRVAVKPTVGVTAVDDRLFNEQLYRNAIAAHAKWQAMASPKKPYSDAASALYWKLQFDGAVGSADARASKGFTRRPLRSSVVHGIK